MDTKNPDFFKLGDDLLSKVREVKEKRKVRKVNHYERQLTRMRRQVCR